MIPSDVCHFRTHRECPCEPGTCQQQPATPAPVITFSWRQHAITIGVGFVAAAITFVSLAPSEQQLKTSALIDQENVHDRSR